MDAGEHVISLSLGNAANPGAMVVVDPTTKFERSQDADGEWRWDHETSFAVTHTERFRAGSPLPVVATRMAEIMSNERLAKKCHLLVDVSLTGTAPIQLLESHGHYATATELTNSGSTEHSGGVTRAPLRDVIGAAKLVQETNRLKVARDLEHASALVTDLLAYEPPPMTSGLDLRGGRNSDLVHALAIALWWADEFTWGDWPRSEGSVRDLGHDAWMSR